MDRLCRLLQKFLQFSVVKVRGWSTVVQSAMLSLFNSVAGRLPDFKEKFWAFLQNFTTLT